MLGETSIAQLPLSSELNPPTPPVVTDVFIENLIGDIEQGMKANTAAQLGGVLVA